MESEETNTENQDGLLTIDPYNDIQASLQAMGVIEDLDLVLLSDSEKIMVNNIKKMSLIITHQALLEIYQSNYYDQDNQSA
jgi:hypothetical protein